VNTSESQTFYVKTLQGGGEGGAGGPVPGDGEQHQQQLRPSAVRQPAQSSADTSGHHREMENISIEVPPSGILSPSAQRRRCRTSQLQDYRLQEYRLPSPPSFKCNVLRESLSVDSQNIPCATLKRRGSWVISVYLWVTTILLFFAGAAKMRLKGYQCW
jgi:hypothetical protein